MGEPVSSMISINEAVRITLEMVAPLEPVLVALDEALGCVLAEAITATEDVPPFDNSSMDGFAVRAVDTLSAPVSLRVVDTAFAGRPSSHSIEVGEAIRIMTGAVLPEGANAVCMVERTRAENDGATVVIEVVVDPGQFVRRAGDDLRSGRRVFDAGEVLAAAHLGVLASLGRTTVWVHPRPRVGVLSTGDELTEGPGPLAASAIRDSNRHALLGLVRNSGFVATDLGIVPDDRKQLRQSLRDAAKDCDAILTSGGVSVGDADLMKGVLFEECGETMKSMSVAVRPAKPFAIGTLSVSATPVFGLPGNPVSSMISFELFARPALRQMAGHAQLYRPVIRAVADDPIGRDADGKVHIVSVRARCDDDGRVHVSAAGAQASHVLSSMARANALAIVPDGVGIASGEYVETILVDIDALGGTSALLTTPITPVS